MIINRRQFIRHGMTTAALASLTACSSWNPITFRCNTDPKGHFDYILTAEPAHFDLVSGGTTFGYGFNGQFPAPVIRATQGKPIRILFQNRLPEPTTIHWHGLRIPIAMDGVPFLSQPPIKPGEDFLYEFTPPDAGTFWYHPHVNSLEQLGKGLVGALIVNEAEPVEFDDEKIFLLKNWHVNEDGSFAPFTSPRNAARMGTPGNLETINGLQQPEYTIPTGGWVRLRFLNVDNTVIYKIAIPNAEAWVVAVDGNSIAQPYRLKSHAMGPGMRLDIALKAPNVADSPVAIKNGKGRILFDFLTLKTTGAPAPSATLMPALPQNPIAKPDLENAEKYNFVFEWEGAVTPTNEHGETNAKFWTINRRGWEGMSADNIPDPLASLSLGKTYIFNLKNVTPHSHPIHMHGFTWTVLKSNRRHITPYHTDTVLLQKNETVSVAFVADNPGRWMYHCHVIEHMKTGLMGYITVA